MATPTTTTEPHLDDQLEQSTGVDTHTAAASEGHTTEGGLAVLGIDTPFLIAQVVNFLLLLVILRWLLYRPVLAMLAKRRETIEAGMKAAEESQKRAAAAAEETAAQLAAARTQAKQIVDEAKAQAEATAAEIRATASQEAEALVVRTRTQLEQEREAVVAKAEQELGELVITATERVLGKHKLELDAADVAVALREAKERA